MGNTTSDNLVDIVDGMSIPQRVDHLITGYIRLNYNQTSDFVFPNDIIKICHKYTGIDKNHDYHLIKSKTELQRELDEKQKWLQRDEQEWSDNELKIVLLGAGGVGKSALFIRLTTGEFLEEYDPTIEDAMRHYFEVDGRRVLWDILDTPGQEEYAAMKELWIRESHLFIFVYNITRRNTLDEVLMLIQDVSRQKDDEIWYGVIAGNKCDLEHQRQIAMSEGQNLPEQHANLKFFETSAKNKINNVEIFYECARWHFYAQDLYVSTKAQQQANKHSTQSCCLLL